MFYLILAIASSALVSIFMKLSEKKRQSETGMLIFNYIACVIFAWLLSPNANPFPQTQGLGITFLVSIISGVLYLVSLILMQQNIKRNGVIFASTFMKLGVIVSVLIAIIIFRESPQLKQIIGIVLAVAAILIFNFDKEGMKGKKNFIMLMLLLLAGGICDSMINIFKNVGPAELSDAYLFLNFFFALICAIILLFIRKEKIGWWDVLFGVLVGIPNYLSSRFVLLALNQLDAVIVYPIYSVATLVVIGVVGMLAFKEKMTIAKGIGLVIVVGALILLS